MHLATGRDTFIDPRIFAYRNFVTGLVFIFVIGIILLASLALLLRKQKVMTPAGAPAAAHMD